MTMQFTETAPGVHTASITDAKTKRTQNVAIIESCGAWQVFIDGEAKLRDLPSFRDAAAAAGKATATRRSFPMVKTAIVLVSLSVVGAGAIGIARLIDGGPAVALETPAPDPFGTATRRTTPATGEAFKNRRRETISASVVEQVKVRTAETRVPSETTRIAAKTPFSASNSLLDRSTKEPARKRSTPQASRQAPVIIERRPSPAAAPITSSDSADPSPEAETTATTEIVTGALPPIPVRAVPSPKPRQASENPTNDTTRPSGTIEQPRRSFAITAPSVSDEGGRRAETEPRNISLGQSVGQIASKPESETFVPRNRVSRRKSATPRNADQQKRATRTRLRQRRSLSTRAASTRRRALRAKRQTAERKANKKVRRARHHRTRKTTRRVVRRSSHRRQRTVSMRPPRQALQMVCIGHTCKFR